MQLINFGECFRRAQDVTGLTDSQIMDDKKVLRQQVYRWRVTEDMHLHKIQRWAEYFGMTLSEFLGIDDEQEAP